jgi:alpha-L-rhamnosidase
VAETPDWMTSLSVRQTIALDEVPRSRIEFDEDAVWLGRPKPSRPATFGTHASAPLLRRTFQLRQPVRSATLRFAAFGYGEAEINGRRVGDAVLDPPPSQFNRTVFSRAHDVTGLLTEGVNVLGVTLGRGYASGVSGPGALWAAEPLLLAQLDVVLTDGSPIRVLSDEDWVMADSGTKDWLFFGESFDARVQTAGWSSPAFDASSWQPVVPQESPTSRVLPARTPPVRVAAELQPIEVTSPADHVTVFDFGKVTAGVARVTARGPAGTGLRVSYGQQLAADGSVALFAPTLNVDHLTLSGDGVDTWTPQFTRHTFQFVEIAVPEGVVVADVSAVALETYTDVSSTGSFATSNPLLNRIHENQRRSLLINHWGYPTDTAGRDRQGWTADSACYLDGAILNFGGLLDLYRDWLLTLRDTQQSDGSVSVFAPDGYEIPMFNDPSWSGMIVLIPWVLYQQSGDITLLSDNYPTMTRWMDLMARTIADTGHLYAGFSFGDHSPPEVGLDGSVDISPPEGSDVTRNAHLFRELRTLAQIGRVLGDAAAGGRYDDLADQVGAAFHTAYFHESRDQYRTPSQAGYRQTPNVVALAFDLVPPEHRDAVFGRLVDDLESRGDRLNTGSIGTKHLLPLLTAHGRGDLAYRIAAQTEFPSWGYWVTQGATSSWETWDNYGPEQTLDHPFLGSVEDWFFQDLAGIRPAEPGYATIRVAPLFPEELDHVSATVTTPYGIVTSAWQRTAGGIGLTITQPEGRTTEVLTSHPAERIQITAGEADVADEGQGARVRTSSTKLALRIHSADDRRS